MVHKVLLQKSPTTGEFIDPNVFSAWYGFEKRGIETGFFTWPELRDGQIELTRDTLIVGGILPVKTALERLGFTSPVNMDYPTCLFTFLNRKIEQCTLSDVRKRCVQTTINGREIEGFYPALFIKPVDGHKQFDGHVVQVYRDLIKTSGITPTTSVFVSEVVEFKSEYRFFSNRGAIVGAGHYRGDPYVAVDTSVVQEAHDIYEASEEAPVSYTMDFGVLANGTTALVEVNDGFAFGCYGLNAVKHAQMLEDRWCELVNYPLSFR